MSYFLRHGEALRKSYHDASGLFTSKDKAVAPQQHHGSLPKGKHGSGLIQAVHEKLAPNLGSTWAAAHEDTIKNVVHNVLAKYPNHSTESKALTIFSDLKNPAKVPAALANKIKQFGSSSKNNGLHDLIHATVSKHEGKSHTAHLGAASAKPAPEPAKATPVKPPSAPHEVKQSQLVPGGAPQFHTNGKTMWKHNNGDVYVKQGHTPGEMENFYEPHKKAILGDDLKTVHHYVDHGVINDPDKKMAESTHVVPAMTLSPSNAKPKAAPLPSEAHETHAQSSELKSLAVATAKGRTLSAAEKSALHDYQGSAYMAINGALRKGKSIPAGTMKQVVEMNRAINDHHLAEDTHVYRGVDDITKVIGDTPAHKAVGLGVLDNGYMSVSTSSSFAKNWGSYSSGQGVVMEFKLPKGSRALPVNHHTGSMEHERELLLSRGTMLNVKAVREEKHKGHTLTVLTMEYV